MATINPPLPPNTRTNADPQIDDHPQDHNRTANALAQIVPLLNNHDIQIASAFALANANANLLARYQSHIVAVTNGGAVGTKNIGTTYTTLTTGTTTAVPAWATTGTAVGLVSVNSVLGPGVGGGGSLAGGLARDLELQARIGNDSSVVSKFVADTAPTPMLVPFIINNPSGNTVTLRARSAGGSQQLTGGGASWIILYFT